MPEPEHLNPHDLSSWLALEAGELCEVAREVGSVGTDAIASEVIEHARELGWDENRLRDMKGGLRAAAVRHLAASGLADLLAVRENFPPAIRLASMRARAFETEAARSADARAELVWHIRNWSEGCRAFVFAAVEVPELEQLEEMRIHDEVRSILLPSLSRYEGGQDSKVRTLLVREELRDSVLASYPFVAEKAREVAVADLVATYDMAASVATEGAVRAHKTAIVLQLRQASVKEVIAEFMVFGSVRPLGRGNPSTLEAEVRAERLASDRDFLLMELAALLHRADGEEPRARTLTAALDMLRAEVEGVGTGLTPYYGSAQAVRNVLLQDLEVSVRDMKALGRSAVRRSGKSVIDRPANDSEWHKPDGFCNP